MRVRAKNEFGTSEISDTFQFHTHSAGTNIDTNIVLEIDKRWLCSCCFTKAYATLPVFCRFSLWTVLRDQIRLMVSIFEIVNLTEAFHCFYVFFVTWKWTCLSPCLKSIDFSQRHILRDRRPGTIACPACWAMGKISKIVYGEETNIHVLHWVD